MAKDQEPTKVMPTVSMPSADLITFRFDQMGKQMDNFDIKLDTILLQTAKFVDAKGVQRMIDDSIAPIKDKQANYTWYWRAIVVGFISLATYILASVVNK